MDSMEMLEQRFLVGQFWGGFLGVFESGQSKPKEMGLSYNAMAVVLKLSLGWLDKKESNSINQLPLFACFA